MHTRGRTQFGFTLTELLVVTAIVGLALSIAMPNFASAERERLDVAEHEVVNALEFARLEAVRTGNPHGVSIVQGDNSIRVFRLEPAGATWTKTYDVRNPIDKQLYTVDFDELAFSAGASVAGSFQFRGVGTSTDVGFSPRGEPIDTVNNLALLDPATVGTVTLTLGTLSRTVQLQPISGRVTAL